MLKIGSALSVEAVGVAEGSRVGSVGPESVAGQTRQAVGSESVGRVAGEGAVGQRGLLGHRAVGQAGGAVGQRSRAVGQA